MRRSLQPRIAVLRQLSTTAAGLDPVVMPERGALPVATPWIDASDADDAELSSVARLLGFSEAVADWLRDPNRPARPRVIDDAVALVLAVPVSDGASPATMSLVEIAVAVTEQRACTTHAADADDVVADAACRVTAGPARQDALAPVGALLEGAIDRYDEIVAALGESQEAHSTSIADADHTTTPTHVVTDGLRLATRIGVVQRQVRRLRQTVIRLRLLLAGLDDTLVAPLDSSWRALDAIDADLDSLSHRLELTTNTQLNLLSARQGEINKAIGAWGGVFAVNAVITGWYGMNIGGLPGAGSWVTVAILMVSVSLALILVLRRIHWL